MLLPHSEWPTGRPLSLRGVVVRRGGRTILSGLDLVFEPGQRSVIIGPSGAGKSTLLRLLNRLDDPDEGVIAIGDVPLRDFPVTAVRKAVGLVFQNSRPFPGTLADNLLYPSWIAGKRAAPDRTALERALHEVGLDPSSLDREAAGLSGGEAQRLAVAVAWMNEPEILALDEPTAALDPASAWRLADSLARRCATKAHRTIAVCHQREHVSWLGDDLVVLEAGRVADRGPVSEILDRHRGRLESNS